MKKARHGATLEIILENPPVNALGAAVRQDLLNAVDGADADSEIEAILISGSGGFFSAGAEISEFASGEMQDPWLPDVLDRIERCSKPVIAAISGPCLGGGLELALACHARIADTSAKVGLPEVKLGILPGAGGTQRLPRLIGADQALTLMISGAMISARQAEALGIIDKLVDDDAVAAALDYIANGGPGRKTGELPPPHDQASAVASHRATMARAARSYAPARIIDCVAAIQEDFAAGARFEADRFAELMRSEASRALQHAFFGERKVARIPGLAAASSRKIEAVGIVGGGLMGTGIALALLAAGKTVTMVEPKSEAADKARATVGKTLARDVEKGRLATATAEARRAALSIAADLSALRDVDLVIEAVFEEISVKKAVFEALDTIVRPDTILASNTSTLDLDIIAGFVADPSRVVGLHFFSPANIMKLLEIVQGAKTAPEVLALAMAFAKSIGKIGVVSGVCDGFIGNRMFEEYLRQAYFLLEEGALPQQVDTALEQWGMAMGPFRTMDLAGQDIGWAIRNRRRIEQPERPYSAIPDRLCELGRFGQKTGRGFYLYPDGRTAAPDPFIDALILDYSSEIGVTRREIGDAEIVERCLFALINEGAKILDEKIAHRPVDIDMVWLNGYGFARERGGPMFQADEYGPARILSRLRDLSNGRNGWSWQPASLIETLAGTNGHFRDLNG